jgi:hypothetical protein
MTRLHLIPLAASSVLLSATPSHGEPICKPQLAVTNIRISELRNLERTWTAAVHVDASRCAVSSGRFDIRFVREKENAPKLEFVEPFTWRTGEAGTGKIEASIDFWIDEAVPDYRIDAAACGCRQ